MNIAKLIGIALIAFGIIGFTYAGISYRSRDKVVDLGPVQITQEKVNTLPIPPILGLVAVIAGIVLVSTSRVKE